MIHNKPKALISYQKQAPVMSRFIIFSVILFFVILITGSIAFILSMRQIIRSNKGIELSQLVEIERVKLETSVNNEVVIVLQMSNSPLIARYFANPNAPELRQMALEEIMSYRRSFASEIIFWISDVDKMFYYNDVDPYLMDPYNPDNYWYNMTLYDTEIYNFNINYNPDLNVTNLWINAPVFDPYGKPIGMLGTGIDITTYLEMVNQNLADRASIFLFNAAGEITGARDPEMVEEKRNIDDELWIGGEGILSLAKTFAPYETQILDTPFGRIAIGTVPLLEWFSVAIMPDSLADYNTAMTAFFIVVLVVIMVVFIIFNVFIFGLLQPLRKSMIEAEEANRAKTAFLANMSHELRTPLNVVIGLTDLIMEENNLTNGITENLHKIGKAGTTLLGIVNDILDFSKVESGKLTLTPTEYQTPSLLNDVITLIVTRLGEKPITFSLNISDDFPRKLFGDDLRVKQIFNNLLSNALKYTQEGKIELTVNCCSAGTDERDTDLWMEIIVSDTGIGISKENMEKLFSDYYQVENNASRRIEGTGLGLSITRLLVELMDGSISVESELGKGSVFLTRFRQGFVDTNTIGHETAEKLRRFRYAEEKLTGSKKLVRLDLSHTKVLVVDDMQTNLDVAAGLLSKYKMQVD